jgi:hypothetical protein
MKFTADKYRIGNERGKWSPTTEGVPREGWSCVEIEDLGRQSAICEMCEDQKIRFVHHMQHENYPRILLVGNRCAGHMEQDDVSAEARTKKMRSRASTRKNWLKRTWKISEAGNEYVTSHGHRVVIRRKGKLWTATIAVGDGSYVRHLHRVFKTSDDAKLAAFDLVTLLLAKN